jgi:hypothetical protein
MLPDTDDAAIQADAYIDGLLTGHRRGPVPMQRTTARLQERSVAQAIDLLEHGLPRFHPSFLFEEWLASQLRRAASRGSAEGAEEGAAGSHMADVLPIGLTPRPPFGPTRLGDRRLWVGGAIASGVSIGAAVFALRRKRD